MKRTLFGLFVMGSLVGLGSLGVYYAQLKLAPKAAAEDPSEQASLGEARDLTPVPIPIASHREPIPSERPGASNPFAAQTAPSEEVAADRYQTVDEADMVVDQSVAGQPRPLADDPSADEIPDADQIALDDNPASSNQAADPYTQRPQNGPVRYAAQPVAAEVIEEIAEDTPADEPAPVAGVPVAGVPVAGEPRRLAPVESPAEDDRYERQTPAGNPLRGSSDQNSEPSPGNERYADEEFPAEPVEKPLEEAYPPAAAQPRAVRPFGDVAGAPNHAAADKGTGRPGDPGLSGPQAPALTIEKIAPPEIQIGKPTKFTIKVHNHGSATAQAVEIHDTVPQGTQLLDTSPPANPGPDGVLVWELGAIKPGDEKTVELELMPTSEGEVGSVATVHFRAEASVRTMATRPMLNIELFGPSQVNKDQQLLLHIKLSNPGSGAASGVVLTEIVPQGLKHVEGKELELDVGTLKPGESRELDLTLVAAEAGMVTNIVKAEGEGKLYAEARTEIEVVAPQLQVAMTGPKRRYLERNATHNISVSNPGTAPAKDIDLVAVLPRTLKFVEANNGGQFDEATHAVYWSLEELPPQETGTVRLTTLPLEAGDAKVLIKGSSKDGLKAESEEVVAIEGLAAINFQLSDLKDPIEVGAETAYEIRVTNQGTKAASNVRLAVIVPRGMQPLSAEGPVRYKIEGQHVVFEPVRQLAPKADTSFTIKVKAIEPGDQRVQVQVATDEIQDPISKEESTRVYGDE